MPTKKQIITFGVLCVIALGLGYWSGMPEEDSGQRAELVAPTVVTNVVTNVLKEVVTNIVVAPQPTPTPPSTIAKPQPSPTPNPIAPEDGKLIADAIVEKAIRSRFSLNKPEGKLTEEDLEKVTRLDLSRTQITDAGLKEVVKLQRLKELSLDRTQITDVGLKELVNLQYLGRLYLEGTKTTAAGVAELEKALPNCKIYGL